MYQASLRREGPGDEAMVNSDAICLKANSGLTQAHPKYTRNRKRCIYIYLCVILHGNDSMRMLRHHVVDLTVIGKGRPRNHGSAVWLELKGYKSASWSVLLGNFRPYSSRVVATAVTVIHGWHCFQLYCSYR